MKAMWPAYSSRDTQVQRTLNSKATLQAQAGREETTRECYGIVGLSYSTPLNFEPTSGHILQSPFAVRGAGFTARSQPITAAKKEASEAANAVGEI